MIAKNIFHDQRSYTLKLAGLLEDDFISAYCPPETVVLRQDNTTNLTNLHTDQSGMIGLIRNLHNLGYTILSMNC